MEQRNITPLRICHGSTDRIAIVLRLCSCGEGVVGGNKPSPRGHENDFKLCLVKICLFNEWGGINGYK